MEPAIITNCMQMRCNIMTKSDIEMEKYRFIFRALQILVCWHFWGDDLHTQTFEGFSSIRLSRT